VIVPDLRGYGQSDAPEAVEAYSVDRLTGDVIGIMEALGVKSAAIVGHDWGGLLAWQMPLLHPTRVAAVIGVNTPYIPDWMLWLHPDVVKPALSQGRMFVADPDHAPIAQMRQVYSPDMYVLMFQDGHKADRAMSLSPRDTIRSTYRKGLLPASQWNDLPRAAANMEVYGKPIPATLPGGDVLTPTEVDVYARAFERTGFTPAINWYRNLDRNWAASRSLDPRVDAPALMVSGRDDFVLRPSMTDGMSAHVPNLTRHIIEKCGHWTPEEQPEELNRLMLAWLATVDRSRFV
jgi:soluble epoxide hydrolase / lipid-phosphate phosphatase